MTSYSVYFLTGAGYAATVEADSEDDAVDKAYNEIPSLCWQCAQIDLGDWDVEEVVNNEQAGDPE